jgi:hypothetical protein
LKKRAERVRRYLQVGPISGPFLRPTSVRAHMEQQGKVDPEAGGLGLPAGHRHTGGVSYTSVSLTDHVLFRVPAPLLVRSHVRP